MWAGQPRGAPAVGAGDRCAAPPGEAVWAALLSSVPLGTDSRFILFFWMPGPSPGDVLRLC